jgi:pimeloyl-ACP methyl ester carboxylesterase
MQSLATRLAPVVFLLATAATAQPSPWRYDLRPGDHLIYRYSLQREAQGEDSQSQTSVHFQTHVLVAGATPEHLSLGFERNRQTAELTVFKIKGKDRLAQELPKFRTRMQGRPVHFAEAMDISPTGEPRYPWEMARESPSHILAVFHEVMTLPPVAVKQGEGWRGATTLSLDFRWVGDESVRGKSCHRVEAASPDGLLKLAYWWSPESGVIEQVELDGSYSGAGAIFHEVARMELESRTRDESVDGWLHSDETRMGALQAILLGPSIPISAEQLSSVLATDDARSQALALAIANRRRLKLPPVFLDRFKQSSNSQFRELAEQQFAPSIPRDKMNCSPVPSPKQSPPKFGTLFDTVPANKTGTEIPYLLRVPLTYREDRPSPLLVYLSGAAGLAMDGVNTAEDVVSGTDYIVLYPHAADLWWKPEIARRFDAVLNQVLAQYNIDRDRIYLTGFSNGGTGSLYMAELWPQRFAAIVSLMGAGQCMEQVKQGLSNLVNLPLLFVHGDKDPLISPECSTTTHSALNDLRPAFKPELKILPDREHDLTLTSDEGLALAFFKDKTRNPFPKHIDFSFTDAQAPRSYWIEIIDGKPGKSEAEARVKADNTIEIRSHDIKKLRLYLRPELMPKQADVRVEWNGKKMFEGPLENFCAATANITTDDPKLDLSDRKDFSLP